MWILFFFFTIILGLYLLSFFPKDLPFLIKLAFIYLAGTIIITLLFFVCYPLLPLSSYTLYLPFLLLFVTFLLKRKIIFSAFKQLFNKRIELIEVFIILFSLVFSSFIFFKTVWYDMPTGQTLIMGKLWSDFGAHVSLIKSFFVGYNFPPEYPLFAHAPIKYYFMFHFHAGLLEKLGLPLFLAINIPTILSFCSLLFIIYSLGTLIFKSRLTGTISVFMFLFNASFSWWYFLKNNFTTNIYLFFKRLFSQIEFPAFNPYDGSLVSGGFWNLNVYTNQRHLALSLAFLLLIIYLFLYKRYNRDIFNAASYFVLGVASGFILLFHGVIFLLLGVLSPILWLIDHQKKKFFYFFLPFILLSLPTLLYLKIGAGGSESSGIKFLPGYLTAYNFTVFNFLRYWALNLGLLCVFVPLGLWRANKSQRLLFLFAIPVFLIGNLFSFSVDVATNHKFFNFTVIIFNLFTAYFLSCLVNNKTGGNRQSQLTESAYMKACGWRAWGSPTERPQPEHVEGEDVGRGRSATGPALLVIFVFFLTISGIIDIFPIVNDTYFGVPDPSHKSDILWIENNTTKNAVIANSYYLYHPASIAGRRIPLGWPYFSWSAGYDTETRVKDLTNLYLATSKNDACNLIKKMDLDYVSINTIITDVNIKFDVAFWKNNFPLLLDNPNSGLLIFEAKKTCD